MANVDEIDLQLRRIGAALDYLEKTEPWAKEIILELQRTLHEYFKRHISDVTVKGPSLLFRFWGHGLWVRTELQVGPAPSFVPHARLVAYRVTESDGSEQLRPIGRQMEIAGPQADQKQKASQKEALPRQFLARVFGEIMEANGASDRIPQMAIALDGKSTMPGS
jgi:hypothetical protein